MSKRVTVEVRGRIIYLGVYLREKGGWRGWRRVSIWDWNKEWEVLKR